MATIDQFSHVVSEIYASSLDAANWTVALSEISRILDGTASGVMMGEGSSRSVMASTLPPEAIATYSQYYYSIDFILDACETGPAGLVRGGRELVAHNFRSEFYADWQRPFKLTDGLFVRLSTGQTPTSFVVAAPRRSEPFDTAERVHLGLLHEQVASELACPDGRAGRMLLCPGPTPESSATMSCGSPVTVRTG